MTPKLVMVTAEGRIVSNEEIPSLEVDENQEPTLVELAQREAARQSTGKTT